MHMRSAVQQEGASWAVWMFLLSDVHFVQREERILNNYTSHAAIRTKVAINIAQQEPKWWVSTRQFYSTLWQQFYSTTLWQQFYSTLWLASQTCPQIQAMVSSILSSRKEEDNEARSLRIFHNWYITVSTMKLSSSAMLTSGWLLWIIAPKV